MKKSSVELTESRVAKLKPAEKNYQVWDSRCSSFGIEVTPAGAKRWVVVTYQKAAGVQKRQWHTLGQWPMKTVETARLEAANLKDQVKRGEDPRAAIQARREAVRMNELLDRYYREHLEVEATWEDGRLTVMKIGRDATGIPEKGNHKEPVRSIEKSIRPVLGPLAVRDIGTSDIADLLFKLRKTAPIQANRVRTMLMGIFKQAEIWELRPVGSNPVTIQGRSPENKRERKLSDKEIFDLGAVIRANEQLPDGPRKRSDPWKEDPFALAVVKLALLAGMRKGEILGLRWDWVHLDEDEIRIPKDFHKTGRKTQKARVIRLCTAAKGVLEGLPRILGNPFVIVGEVPGAAMVDINKPWHRLREAAGLAEKDNPQDDDATLHDLRRTFASVAADLGVPELFIGALLGHAVVTITQRYARVSQDPLKETVEAIGSRIAGLLAGRIDPTTEAQERRKAPEQPA